MAKPIQYYKVIILQLNKFILNKKTGEELMSTQEPCTQMFTEALFIVDKTWKQPRYLIGEWIHKLWCIQTMGKKKKKTFLEVHFLFCSYFLK